MDELVSNRAYEIMQRKMMKKDFIGERGFKQLIPPFREVIRKRGWSLLCEHHSIGFAALEREFYSNLVGRKEKACYIRGKWISIGIKEINKAFRVSEQKDESKFKKIKKDPDHQKIMELLAVGKGEWNDTKKNPFDSISRGLLTKEAKVWFYFVSSVLRPCT